MNAILSLGPEGMKVEFGATQIVSKHAEPSDLFAAVRRKQLSDWDAKWYDRRGPETMQVRPRKMLRRMKRV